MTFREEDKKYLRLREEWLVGVNKAHHPGHGIRIDEVDNLMLISYKLQRCIRNYLVKTKIDAPSEVKVPLLPEALKTARKAVSPAFGVVSLFYEAESLEALSRSAYRWLKANDKLI